MAAFIQPDDVRAKQGKDEKLEADADAWLARGVPGDKRSDRREQEKIAYELGAISREELDLYDPTNYWDTRESAFMLFASPEGMAYARPSIVDSSDIDPDEIDADYDTGEEWNYRVDVPELRERRMLMRHIDDEDDWGHPFKEPIERMDIGPRKTCTKCGRTKGTSLFYANPRSKDKFSSWCILCQKAANKRSERPSAAEWLEEYLRSNPNSESSTVKLEARNAGLSDGALLRARKRLRVKISRAGNPAKTYWSLESTTPP